MADDRPRIRVERRHQGKVALVVVDRPEVHNALDLAAMDQLAAAVAGLGRDGDLLAVVVTGAGEKAFVSGGDLKDLHGVREHAAALRMAETMGGALAGLSALPVPVIAAVNGHAFGGGCELAVACDYRIAGDHVRFGFRAVKFGVMGGWGGTTRLLRIIGRSRALKLLVTGEDLDAATALDIGLVDEVVPQGAVLERALAFASEIAAGSPLAVRATKEALHAAEDLDFDDARALEAERFAETWVSEDHAEALAAFRAGRPPKWRGR